MTTRSSSKIESWLILIKFHFDDTPTTTALSRFFVTAYVVDIAPAAKMHQNVRYSMMEWASRTSPSTNLSWRSTSEEIDLYELSFVSVIERTHTKTPHFFVETKIGRNRIRPEPSGGSRGAEIHSQKHFLVFQAPLHTLCAGCLRNSRSALRTYRLDCQSNYMMALSI